MLSMIPYPILLWMGLIFMMTRGSRQKVYVVENGVVKNLLMTRIPREGFEKSTDTQES